MPAEMVILDTNVLVAAGFNPRSASAYIVERVRSGRLRMIWSEPTRNETRHILEKIPPLSWDRVAALYREENRHPAELAPEKFDFISDPDDRKFASLSAASGAILLTNDHDLLTHRGRAPCEIWTPGEYRARPPE